MAKQVNKRFVIVLASVVVVGALAVVGVGYMALVGRVENMVTKGDAFAAAGDWEKAAAQYERAVGHDRTRTDWLIKWRDAMVKTVPPSEVQYRRQYDFYRSLLDLIAMQKPSDARAQVEYIAELDRFVRTVGGGRENLENLIKEIDDSLRGIGPESPEAIGMRKQRALATVEVMFLTAVEEPERQRAVEAFRAALVANPADDEAADGIVRWHAAEAARAQREGKPEGIERALRAALDEAGAFLSAHPDSPRTALTALTVFQAQRSATVTSLEEARKASDELRAEADKVLATMAAAAPETLPVDFIDRATTVLLRALGRSGAAPLLDILDRRIAAGSGDARLGLLRGYLLRETQRYEEALTQYQAVVDQPDLPVSLEGRLMPERRVAALSAQINVAMQQWDNASTPAEKEAALALAKRYRQALASKSSIATKDAELLADAKLALAQGLFADAVARLTEIRSRPAGQTLEVSQLLAQALEQQQNLGEARLILEGIVREAPALAWAQFRLGEVCLRLGELERAYAAYNQVIQLDPKNEAARARLSSVATALKPEGSKDVAVDPIVKALVESREARAAGDTATARRIIEGARAGAQWDRRLVLEQVQISLRDGDREGAIRALDEAIAARPDEQMFKQQRVRLNHADPVEAALALIETSEMSEADKEVERFEVFIGSGRRGDAQAALARAEALTPDNPRVIDYSFLMALNEQNFDKARSVAQRAASLNIDQANGLLYQGRIELVRGEGAQAVATLERAVQAVPFNPAARRLLAQALTLAGRANEAIEAYKRAYEGRPDDMVTARDYADSLIRANRGAEALAVLGPETGILRFGQDEDIYARWLELEARFGDRAKVLKVREETLKNRPENHANAFALAQLYMEDSNYARSREIIDALGAQQSVDRLALALLLGSWHGRQGRVDEGIGAVRGYIDSVPADQRTVSLYTGLAQFLGAFGRDAEVADALEQGRLHQKDNLFEADRSLADHHFDRATRLAMEMGAAQASGDAEAAAKAKQDNSAALEKALTVYMRVMDGFKGDGEIRNAIEKRACETLLRMERFDEAQKIIAGLASRTPDDLQVLMLEGAIAAGRKDRRTARQKFDRAVQQYPNDPNVFFQRALFNAEEPALLNDVIQDLTQCTRLRPGFTRAWLARFELLSREGRKDDAFAALRAGVKAAPDDNELRATLIRRLATEGRLPEAQEEALRAVEQNPDNLQWLTLAARAMAQFQRWPQASDLHRRLYEKRPSPELAGVVLDVSLRPGVAVPRKELGMFLSEFEKVAYKSVPDIMLRARARQAMGQSDEAEKLTREAIGLVGEDPEASDLFVTELMKLKASPRETLDWLEKASAEKRLNVAMEIVRISAKAGATTRREWPDLLSEARTMDAKVTDPVVRFAWHRLIGQIHYRLGDFEQAVAAYREALKLREGDIQVNNDLAYILVADLGRAEEAVSHAEAAAEAIARQGGENSAVLDTVGLVYLRVGRLKEAVEVLQRAVQTAGSPAELAVAEAHLGLARLGTGDRAGAE
ncbi:MAG TPA: hypothetical protein DEB06_11375, partial [Phycisphaerales bacterium]|nr:hypothetical protein [Phycisphaerales bacterium]